MNIPHMSVGNRFEVWLESKWDDLLGISSCPTSEVVGKIERFWEHWRRSPGTILDECGGMFIANYLCSLQYEERIGGICFHYGPWSRRHVTDEEWHAIAKLTDRDARDWGQVG